MRIVSTIVLIPTLLGVSVNAGWCPEPADLGMPIGSYTGATMAAPDNKPAAVPWEFDLRNPENMTRSQRWQMVGKERAAGRLQTDQELKNFLATGNPAKSWTPPEQKPLVRPKWMSDAKWQEFQKSRPKPPDFVQGNLLRVPKLTMEENAKLQGGTLTDLPGAVPIPPPAKPTTTTSTTTTPSAGYQPVTKLGVHRTQTESYKPVTKLGVHPTQAAPAVRLSTSAADRLVSSHRETVGTRTTLRSGFTAPAKTVSAAPGTTALDRMTGVTSSGAGNTKTNGRVNAPPVVRYSITPPAQRAQDTFRQPK